MSTSRRTGDTDPGARLERAIEVFLAQPERSAAETAHVLEQHPELRELLEPMLGGSAAAAPVDDPAANDDGEVLGDFRLLRELGRGGMGIVYEAWQRSLDRKVAVKVLSPALVASPSAVARFRREAAAAGKLRHRNIVEVYGFGSGGGRHFFAMQLVDGVSLHDCMERFRPKAAAIAVGIQLADALAHAHAAGLVHRDVKPANVLVQRDDSVLLTDFGVASDEALPSLTREGGFLGTLDYASPEQVRGDAIDARTDVWSTGVVLCELLTGEHPFRASTQQATMQHILTVEPQLHRRTDLSRDLAAVLGRALEKDPARRYASARALLDDLRALKNGGPVSARLPTPPERLARWARREPWRALAAAVLLVALPVVAGTLGFLWANAPRIEAARRAEAARRREETLAHVWWCYLEDEPRAGIALLDAMGAADEEVQVTRATLLMSAGDRGAAIGALADAHGAAADLVRQDLTPNGSAPGVTDDGSLDDFVTFVRASLLLDRIRNSESSDPELLQRATTLAERAVALAPEPRLAYLVTLADVAFHADSATGRDLAERALARHFPDSSVARRKRASLLGRVAPERAIELLDDGGGGTPLVGAFLLRGVALEALGKLDDAVAAYRRATEEQPLRARAWTNLGVALRKQKQFAESETALRRATELAPREAFAWNALGLTLRSAGARDRARQAFEHAMALRPRYAPAAYNLGNLLKADGDAAGSLAAFERAVSADPSDVRALANLGDALVRAGRKQEALARFVRAAELAPNELIPQYNVARTALELALPQFALPAARRAAELDARGHFGSWLLADALLAVPDGDAAAALSAARRADERAAGKDVDVRITLARAMARSGDRAGAVDLLERSRNEAAFAGDGDRAAIDKVLDELRATQTPR